MLFRSLQYTHGTMETARFKYLRSTAGGSWSIPSIVDLLREADESPGHTASCLSWRTSGSLQQIFGLQTLVPAHPLTADPHFDVWLHDEEDVLPFGITGPALIDLTNSTVAARANCSDFYLRLPLVGVIVVTLGRPGRHVAAGLAARNYSLIASGGSEHSGSGMFRPRWWETGCRDEIWMGQDTLIWAAQDLCANHTALTTPGRPFAELLWTAQAEYPLPPRRPSGDRYSANAARWLPYLRCTDSGWAVESAGWIAATDGSVRASRPASDDGPYEPTALGAGVLLARPGAFLDDPALLLPNLLAREVYSIAPPPRHNDGSTRPPYVHMHRGHSDQANHSCGHSLRVLGEPMSMRAELGGIHLALEKTPADEELTILTDSLSAIHLLCRWRRKRILTPYVHRAKCREIGRAHV